VSAAHRCQHLKISMRLTPNFDIMGPNGKQETSWQGCHGGILRCAHLGSRHDHIAEAQQGGDHDGELHIY